MHSTSAPALVTTPGPGKSRHHGTGYRSDGDFLEAVSGTEGDVQERRQ
jgi:hypothetical protein